MAVIDPLTRRLDSFARVFSNRSFLLFSVGNGASLIGFWMLQLVVGWETWTLTRSQSWLGIMAFAQFAPAVVFSLIGGVLADRMNRLHILRFGQWGIAAAVVALAVLDWSGSLTVWWLVAVLTFTGVIGGINLPSRLAITPSLVPPEHLATGMAVNSITFNSSRFIGPLVAAPMLGLFGAGLVFAVIAVAFAANALCLAAMPDLDAEPQDSATAAPVGLLKVVTDLAHDRAIATVMGFQLLTGLTVVGARELFPAFADTVFGQGETGLAALSAALGVGAVGGALFVSGGVGAGVARRHIVWGSVVFALTLAAFAATDSFTLALVILFVHGAAMSTSGIASTIYVQQRAPRDRLGRVLSVYGLIFRAAPALGAVVLGVTADVVGLGPATLVAGLLAAVVILLFRRGLN